MLPLVILFAINHLVVYIFIFILQVYKFKYLRVHIVTNTVSPCCYYLIIWKNNLAFPRYWQMKAISLKKKFCLAWTGLFLHIISRQILQENSWNNEILAYSLSSILAGTMFSPKSWTIFISSWIVPARSNSFTAIS